MQHFMSKLIAVAVVSTLSASIAVAGGHITKITVDCPSVSAKTKDKITNYGTYLAGEGTLRVNGDAPTHPLFQGPTVPGANIPVDLKEAGYSNKGASYNPANGTVTCFFKTSKAFDAFSISYIMANALNGTTAGSGFEQIHIKVPAGLM